MEIARTVGITLLTAGTILGIATAVDPDNVALAVDKAAYQTALTTGLKSEPLRAGPNDTTITVNGWTRVIRPGTQHNVDECQTAVLWTGPMPTPTTDGPSVILGHDYCGFDRYNHLTNGTHVTIHGPDGASTYEVYAHHRISRNGGPVGDLFTEGDLILQSCEGDGIGFTYLRRVTH